MNKTALPVHRFGFEFGRFRGKCGKAKTIDDFFPCSHSAPLVYCPITSFQELVKGENHIRFPFTGLTVTLNNPVTQSPRRFLD